MAKFIGIKIVDAVLMNSEEASKLLNKPIFVGNAYTNDDGTVSGYLVTDSDGFRSWCPADQFDEANILMDDLYSKEDLLKIVRNHTLTLLKKRG